MGEIIFTFGFNALHDTQTEDTDKPTNPWLELIIASNKNEKEPTKLWNLVQEEIARGGPFRLDDQSALYHLRQIFGDQHELAFRILHDIGALEYTATINLGTVEFFDVNFQTLYSTCPSIFREVISKRRLLLMLPVFTKQPILLTAFFIKRFHLIERDLVSSRCLKTQNLL